MPASEVLAAPTLLDEDFDRARRLIRAAAGIDLNDSKRSLVFGRLNPRLRELRLPSFSAYLDLLERPDSTEWPRFINALTTNLTSFLREPHHFEMFAQHLRTLPSGHVPRVWCAAASTGEEPYSIAATLVDTLGERARSDILATDIDTDVLARAQRGVYPIDALERLDEGFVKRHFLRGQGANAGFARVKPALAQRLTFKSLNLIAPQWPVQGPFDVIFCRNVLIYFERDVRRAIVRRMHGLLAPQGLLFVGHSENFTDCSDVLTLQGQTAYRRRS